MSFIRRPCIIHVTIISEPVPQISFKFWLLLALHHMLRCFVFYFFFLNAFSNFLQLFFSVLLTWDHVGTKFATPSNCFQIISKVLLNFLPNRPHKSNVLDFQNFEFPFLALLDFVSRATVMAQSSLVHHLSVVHPLSDFSDFLETAAWIQARFYGQLPIHQTDSSR